MPDNVIHVLETSGIVILCSLIKIPVNCNLDILNTRMCNLVLAEESFHTRKSMGTCTVVQNSPFACSFSGEVRPHLTNTGKEALENMTVKIFLIHDAMQ